MTALGKTARNFLRDEEGASLVEFALIVILFFFLLFTLIDFGRLGASYVMIEKAAQLAARTVVVREPACAGVPERHVRPTTVSASPPRFGTSCRSGSDVCAAETTVSCSGDLSNGTVAEVWARIQPLLPPDVQPSDLRFEYRFDQRLGFLGGPYTPMVTVEVTPPAFQFTSPLGAMASSLTDSGSTLGSPTAYGGFSVSMPAEDLGG